MITPIRCVAAPDSLKNENLSVAIIISLKLVINPAAKRSLFRHLIGYSTSSALSVSDAEELSL